jgi:hypothetical protein
VVPCEIAIAEQNPQMVGWHQPVCCKELEDFAVSVVKRRERSVDRLAA